MRLVNFKKLINNLIDLLNGTNNCRSSKSELMIYRIRVFYLFAVVHLIETILSITIWEVERNFKFQNYDPSHLTRIHYCSR